jgi:hypothetical protein
MKEQRHLPPTLIEDKSGSVVIEETRDESPWREER